MRSCGANPFSQAICTRRRRAPHPAAPVRPRSTEARGGDERLFALVAALALACVRCATAEVPHAAPHEPIDAGVSGGEDASPVESAPADPDATAPTSDAV